jgi:dolichol kinase
MTDGKEPTPNQLNRATKSLGGSLVFSAVRCTVQYVLLPFVLPWVGLAGAASAAISLLLGLAAVSIILYNMIKLWPTNWRWRYLGLGTLMLFILSVFLFDDLQKLLG